MLILYVEAPFGACRTFTAGWYRPTATFLTPSAAYGLALNVAGLETRLREGAESHDERTPASLTRPNLPSVRLALGAPVADDRDPYPRVQTLYQQLHNYPVGTSGMERAESARGNKYNITPVRREFLSDVRVVIALNGNAELEDRVRRGLRGEFNPERYGVPFLGDNAFLLDRLEERSAVPLTHWYERVTEGGLGETHSRTTRLTILIDRADLSRTVSALFAPTDTPSDVIPEAAWTVIEPPAPEIPPSPRSKKKKP
jgi:CRISPR-associated protein Cas5t